MQRLKHDVKAFTLALKDPRVPWPARILICIAVAYALSPFDLIPDFIPVLGLLDDLLIIPLLLMLAARLIPKNLLAEYRKRARRESAVTKAR